MTYPERHWQTTAFRPDPASGWRVAVCDDAVTAHAVVGWLEQTLWVKFNERSKWDQPDLDSPLAESGNVRVVMACATEANGFEPRPWLDLITDDATVIPVAPGDPLPDAEPRKGQRPVKRGGSR